MTTTPARPRFTPDADGEYPCPATDCDHVSTRTQGISRHWNQQHAVFTPTDEDLELPDSQDDETFSDEVNALHAMLYGTDTPDTLPDHATTGEEVTPPAVPSGAGHAVAGVEEPGEEVEPPPAAPSRPATPVRLLTPGQVQTHRPRTLTTHVREAVDAITHLQSAGFSTGQAAAIVCRYLGVRP